MRSRHCGILAERLHSRLECVGGIVEHISIFSFCDCFVGYVDLAHLSALLQPFLCIHLFSFSLSSLSFFSLSLFSLSLIHFSISSSLYRFPLLLPLQPPPPLPLLSIFPFLSPFLHSAIRAASALQRWLWRQRCSKKERLERVRALKVTASLTNVFSWLSFFTASGVGGVFGWWR